MSSGVGMIVFGLGAPGSDSSSSSRSSNCLLTSYSDADVSWSVRVLSVISGVSNGDDASDVNAEDEDPSALMNRPALSLGGRDFFFVRLTEGNAVMSGRFLYSKWERLCLVRGLLAVSDAVVLLFSRR